MLLGLPGWVISTKITIDPKCIDPKYLDALNRHDQPTSRDPVVLLMVQKSCITWDDAKNPGKWWDFFQATSTGELIPDFERTINVVCHKFLCVCMFHFRDIQRKTATAAPFPFLWKANNKTHLYIYNLYVRAPHLEKSVQNGATNSIPSMVYLSTFSWFLW